MGSRPRATFQKRQKEQARQEKQRAKMQRKLQRRLEKQAGSAEAETPSSSHGPNPAECQSGIEDETNSTTNPDV